MSDIAVVATSPAYMASLGAMIDAHARLGEVFESNEALGDYATMETRLRLVGAMPGVIALAGGRRLETDTRLADLVEPRLVYLAAFQLPDPDRFAEARDRYAGLAEWLRLQHDRGIPIAACGAAVLHLAAAGLLGDGTCAASPRLVGPLRRLAPRIHVDSDQPIRRIGTVWTCNRDADNPALAVRLLSESFSLNLGRNLAMREPPGPAAAELLELVDPVVIRARMWIRDRFTRRFRIADLAAELGLSHQSLIRRFREAGSATPREFVQRTRISAATTMLAETHRPVGEIAQLVGYADVASFRRVFVETTGTTPAAFRASQRATAGGS